jgi:hypothetical protein
VTFFILGSRFFILLQINSLQRRGNYCRLSPLFCFKKEEKKKEEERKNRKREKGGQKKK